MLITTAFAFGKVLDFQGNECLRKQHIYKENKMQFLPIILASFRRVNSRAFFIINLTVKYACVYSNKTSKSSI